MTKTIKKSKPCPCPIHKGKKLSLTKDSKGRFLFWHKGAEPEGTQGYCREWRNKTQNEANKAGRKAIKKAIKKKKRMKQSSLRKQNNQTQVNQNPNRTMICTNCKNTLSYYRQFQSNGRGGIRQPCKFCIAKSRAAKKSKLIAKKISLDAET